jgi:1-phosphofructokinase
VAVFGPSPLLTVTIEDRAGRDEIHVHPGGQGVWVSRMAAELGATPVLCGFVGGETGAVLEGLLAATPGERRLVTTARASRGAARAGSSVRRPQATRRSARRRSTQDAGRRR